MQHEWKHWTCKLFLFTVFIINNSKSEYNCPIECSCLGNVVVCKDLMLTEVPNHLPPWAEILVLKGNNFSTLKFNVLLQLPKLHEIDVSSNHLYDNFSLSVSDEAQVRCLKINKNHLTDIPKLQLPFLTQLSLTHNMITKINGTVILQFPELQSLDLSNNQIINVLPDSFLVPNQLKFLNLNSNSINSLDVNSFKNLSLLQELRLSKNRLTTLKNIFKNHDHLRILEVNHNELSQVEALAFKELRNIEKLKLRRNKIETLNDGAFWQLNNLTELQLDYNSLAIVSKGALFGLDNLRVLTLSHNKINIVQLQAWDVCKEIAELDLSFNQMNYIDRNTFTSLHKLKKLQISNNYISSIENAFEGLGNLQELDLSSNKISYVIEDAGGAFLSLSQLQKLEVADNQIKSINKYAFAGLSQLKELNLLANNITSIQENPFLKLNSLRSLKINASTLLCDCGMQWFSSWLNRNQYDGVDVRCGYPTSLNGTKIAKLYFSNFTCDQHPKPILIEEPASQLCTKGDNLTLTCRALSTNRNPLTFSWKRNNKIIGDKSIQKDVNLVNNDTVQGSSSLYLRNLSDLHNGRYQCVVTNIYGTTYSEKANITVLAYPSFTKVPSDLKVAVGSTARLECSATGFPSPVIAWQKDGGNDFPAARERRMHKMPTDDVLFIINVKSMDSGVYSCTAQNLAGMFTANATLTVLEIPSFVKPMENKEVALGGSIVMECMASGSPKPQLNWRKNGYPLQTNERHFLTAENQLLIIVNTISSDAGNYECEMTNSLGSAVGASLLTIKANAKSLEAVVRDDDIIGLIIIAVVCCAVGTSVIWVIIIYHTRKQINDSTRNTVSRNIFPPPIFSAEDSQPYVNSFQRNKSIKCESNDQLQLCLPGSSVVMKKTASEDDNITCFQGSELLIHKSNCDQQLLPQDRE